MSGEREVAPATGSRTAHDPAIDSPAYRSPLTAHRTPWEVWVDRVGRPGHTNMALDHALLDLAEREGRAMLRLYRWAPHCLSFGRHEPAARRYDRRRIESLGLACVRRPTGGRAVWHARELTYAVAAPHALLGSLRESYRTIHRMLAAALQSLGALAELAPPPPRALRPDAGPCFAAAGGGEVLVGGRKVVGSAQVRRGTAFLQHGSVLLEDGQQMLGDLGAPLGAEAAAPLSVILGRRVAFEEAAGAIIEAARAWGGVWRERDDAELGPMASAHEARYRSPEWTWGA